jgi:hypothetical protein
MKVSRLTRLSDLADDLLCQVIAPLGGKAAPLRGVSWQMKRVFESTVKTVCVREREGSR